MNIFFIIGVILLCSLNGDVHPTTSVKHVSFDMRYWNHA